MVVTISRKLGSLGTHIGRALAQKLDYAYVDKKHLSQIMRDYGFSRFDNIYERVPSLWEMYDEYREMTINFLAETIMAVGQHDDVVIAGRGGFGLFDSYSGVVNVRIKAPDFCRIERVMKERNLSLSEAKKVVQKNDRARRAFVESDFRFEYNNTKEFDLILDTSLLSTAKCVDILFEAVTSSLDCRQHDDRPHINTVEVEKVLQAHVSNMLSRFKENPESNVRKIEEIG